MTELPPRSSAGLPSALDALPSVAGRSLAVFCDYDGTLTPIVPDPAAAVLSAGTRSILTRLARCCPLGVVSGRDLAEIRTLVDVAGVMYVGSHGFEIDGPGDQHYEHQAARPLLPEIDRVEHELREALSSLGGILVDRKRYAVAVHTRRAESEEDRRRAGQTVGATSERFPRLRSQRGKEVIELRPDVDWDKGRAVSYLVDRLALGPDPLVVYLGDDRTDEDAFLFVRRNSGVGVIVGATESTYATHRLADPSEVPRFLRELAQVVC